MTEGPGFDWFDAAGPALFGSRCATCGSGFFPAAAFCWRCMRRTATASFGGRGRVLARTVARVTPDGFSSPLDFAAVALGGTTVIAQAEPGYTDGDWVELAAGPVALREGRRVIGPIFRPASDPGERGGRQTPPAGDPPCVPSTAGGTGESYLAGTSMTSFGRHDTPLPALAARAALDAVADAGLDLDVVDALIVGTAFGGAALGQRMLRHLPWHGRPVVNVENACASGATALLEAVNWVGSGRARCVVAVGADAVLSAGGGLLPLDRADPHVAVGLTLPALYALSADAYLRSTGAPPETLADLVVRSRRAASRNPLARYRDVVTRDAVLASRAIADPLTLLQCSPNADGAAAAVVVGESLGGAVEDPVCVESLVLGSGRPGRFERDGVARHVAGTAYDRAGVDPDTVDVAEIHDAFTPAALTALEDLGFTAPNTAWKRILAGDFESPGRGPVVNPSGGLLSRGHPPGATALAQVHEIVNQLRHRAGARQVERAHLGIVHSRGGSVLELETNACAVGVFRRTDERNRNP